MYACEVIVKQIADIPTVSKKILLWKSVSYHWKYTVNISTKTPLKQAICLQQIPMKTTEISFPLLSAVHYSHWQ